MHRLYHGDLLHVTGGFQDNTVDAIVTDPPYEMLPAAWDSWNPAHWKELYRITKPSGLLAFTIGPQVAHRRIPDVENAGWHLLEVGCWIWGSGRPVPAPADVLDAGDGRLKRSYDLVYFFSKNRPFLHIEDARGEYRAGSSTGKPYEIGHTTARSGIGRQVARAPFKERKAYAGGKNYWPANVAISADMPEPDRRAIFHSSGYDFIFAVKRLTAKGRTDATHHPTEKPLDLMAQIIRLVSLEGDTVLDPYSGSGTTGIAAATLDRHYLGIERNDVFLDFQAAKFRNADYPLEIIRTDLAA